MGTPGGTLFHLTAWRRVLEETFGYRAHYLAARRDTETVGILPLFELGAARRPRCLLSLPFAVDAGVCSNDDAARRVLAEAATALAVERGAGYVELRDAWDAPGFETQLGGSFRFRRPLYASDAENFAAIPRKQRRMIRVGQAAGLQARIETDGVSVLYHLAALTMRRLGSPVFPERYFAALRRHFGESCEIVSVWRNATPVAAVMSFYARGAIVPYYSGARHEFFRYAVNDFMYWSVMQQARQRGAREFDFGRSRNGSGAYAFKRHWGFAPEPMRHRVRVVRGPAPAAAGGLGLARSLWRHTPLALTRLLGPTLIKRVGVYYT